MIKQITIALVAALALIAVPGARADLTTCRTGPGCLNGTDSYDWTNNYGAPFSPIPNGSTATSNGGATLTVSLAGGGNGERRDQGNGWAGNFNPGDELFWTSSPGQGPLTFLFSNPLSGLGANIQSDYFGSFTAQLQAFDINGNLIDSQIENGNSTSNGDGSAIFIGLTNDPGIASATFSLTSSSNDVNDFAINQLDTVVATPEPGFYVPVAGLMVALAFAKLRKARELRTSEK
ncbi:MAG: hypothetical protein JOZ22_15335 [Acidobacteriia bacterium]|nr:hypothetical protein [Terriglobia bacterium]